MTMDPSEKDALMHTPGAPVRSRFAVQVLGSSAVISVPLDDYRRLLRFSRLNGAAVQDRRVNINGRILKQDGSVAASFDDTLENPESSYVKTIPLALGTYRLELVVKEMASGRVVRESGEFQVR